jgi:hypothetical protein
MRYSMSFPVSRLVPGMGMAPMRMAPRAATYHCGIRGSMMKTGSPFFTPRPVSALPMRLVSRAIDDHVYRPVSDPAESSASRASPSGVATARFSSTSRTKLNRSGTSSRKAARSAS